MKENTKEIISYVFVGIMTTLVNYIVYFVLLMIHCHWLVANSISWFFAVIFAYYANKKYVFESNRKGADTLKEAGAFYSGRVFSGVVNLIGMKLFIDWIGINEFISKAILSIVVLVLNYLLSKFLVFKKKS